MEKQRRIFITDASLEIGMYFAEHFAKKEAGLNITALICCIDSGWTA